MPPSDSGCTLSRQSGQRMNFRRGWATYLGGKKSGRPAGLGRYSVRLHPRPGAGG